MANKYFPFYASFTKALNRMSDEEAGKLIKALGNHAFNGEEPEDLDDLSPIIGALYDSWTPLTDDAMAKNERLTKNGSQPKQAKKQPTKPASSKKPKQTKQPEKQPEEPEKQLLKQEKVLLKQESEVASSKNSEETKQPSHIEKEKEKEREKENEIASKLASQGLGYPEMAFGAGAYEASMRSREIRPPDSLSLPETPFDPSADLEYADDLETPSDVLPCMSRSELSERGNPLFFTDSRDVKHYTPLGALQADYHQRTGKTDYLTLQRAIKLRCPTNCDGAPERMHECWKCVHKALGKWDKAKSATPARIIDRIIADERGF